MDRVSQDSEMRETPIGPIASDWQLARLSDLTVECCERNQALRFGRDDVLSVDNELGLIPSDRTLGDDFSRYKIVEKHSFAYNPMRLNVGSIGVREELSPAIVSPDYIVFRCRREDADPGYLDEFRRCAAWQRQIDQSGQGSVRIRYYYHHIGKFLVPLPPLPEQQAIAHVLRTVRKAKEATEKVVAATRQLKQSLMRHLFTYGLVRFNEADKVELQEGEDGRAPKHWKVTRLDAIARLSTGTTPSTKRQEYYCGTIPFIKTTEVANNVIKSTQSLISQEAVDDYSLKLYPPGTVFMAMYGQGKTRGQVALLEIAATTTQNTAAIVPKEGVDARFLWLQLMSKYDLLRGKGFHGQLSHLNLGYLRKLEIAVPPDDEQLQISKILSAVQGKLEAEDKRLGSLEALFTSLLHNLMTGQVRVHDVGPSIPAEVA